MASAPCSSRSCGCRFRLHRAEASLSPELSPAETGAGCTPARLPDSAGPSTGVAFRNPRAEIILPTGNHVFTIGANWTLNRFVKLQVNGIREAVERDRNPVLPARFPAGAFWNKVFRLQFVL